MQATRALIFVAMILATTTMAPAADSKGDVSGNIQHSSVRKSATVVYLEGVPASTAATDGKHVVLDQKGKVFKPGVLAIPVGTTVDFLNSDDFEHNVFSPDGEKYDLGNWGLGETRSYKFEKPGVYAQLCRVHPEMIGYVVVLDTPHFAIADQTGQFGLAELPPGEWKLKVWNERLRPKQLKQSFPVTITAGQESEIDIAF